MKISVVFVDNGEPTVEMSLQSIKSQNVDEIIVAHGPNTNVDVVKRYADKMFGPLSSIGYARYIGVMNARNRIVALADSDTIYGVNYFAYALEDFERYDVDIVKAGNVMSIQMITDPIGFIENFVMRIGGAYEFGWVIKRDIIENLDEKDVEKLKNPRTDFGHIPKIITRKTFIDHRMTCYTRIPTYFWREYAYPTIGSVIPITAVASIITITLLKRFIP
jgi:hypothetical protein